MPFPADSAPAGATDCHFHIFGPYERFPLSAGRHYDPPEAGLAAYRAVASGLGLQRFVVVQPSIYGTDNACTLDAVAQLGASVARAVVVIDASVSDAALAAMHAAGARGIRFNAVSGNGAPLDGLAPLAARIAPLGWHVQVYVDGLQLPTLAPQLRALPVPVVIDHMGQLDSRLGIDHPAFRALLDLLHTQHCWVKLCAYRASADGPPYGDMRAPARAMIAAAPGRCLWGTDWPHPSLAGRPMPDDGALFALLADWTPDAALRRQILVDNPARLYGF